MSAASERRGRLNILSVTTLYPTNQDPGSGLFIRSRLQHVGEFADIRVVAAATGHGAQVSRDGNLSVVQAPWFYLPGSGFFTAVFLAGCLLPKIYRLRREHPFELIDAHFGHPEGVATAMLAAILKVPFTVTLRGSEVEHGRRVFRRRCIRWAFRRAARVITVSKNLRDFAIGLGADPLRTAVIPNGVDGDVFRPLDRTACRRKHGIRPEAKVIVCAGHLIELKGHHHVVRALRSVVAEGIDAELWIAGGQGRAASYESQVRSTIEELGLQERVRLLGRVEPAGLAELLNAADVFCLASSREGWPNVVHEALSCGTPVVATRVGAIPEMIESDEYGIVWPADQVARIGEPLAAALRKDWNRDRIASWGRARSWRQVAREVIEQFELALGTAAA